MLAGFKWIWSPISCEVHFNGGIKLLGFLKNMSQKSINFVQHLNPVSNQMEWKVVDEDYDYNQEIATSCYGDMLHDVERNQKFGLALEKAIRKMQSCGKKAHVLDIGTGTGLLAMLAVRFGADSVVACEAFLPMANCAVNIIGQNHYSEHIKVIKKHSTSLTVGENGDLPQRANILVSEVFDTELIGEGAIKTFNHAHEHLLEKDCIVIPSSGTVYAQVVESSLAQKWNRLQDWKDDGKVLIKVPVEIKHCPGAAAVHDIQLSQLPQKSFKALTPVIPVFRFDWLAARKIPTHRQEQFPTVAIETGKAQVVFMWWDLNMDVDGEILLSCAPVWEHPSKNDAFRDSDSSFGNPAKHIPWRDHWMQAVYFLSKEVYFKTNDQITLISNHDEFSFWFEVSDGSSCITNGVRGKDLESFRPVCTCTFHFLLSRTRIGAINDDRRRQIYYKSLMKIIQKDSVCVVLGDMSLLGILAAKLGAKKVFIVENNPSICRVIESITSLNELDDIICQCSKVDEVCNHLKETPGILEDIIILSEPFFRNAILPWDNISFWYVKDQFLNQITKLKQGDGNLNVVVSPQRCYLKGLAVKFDDLWKISTPLSSCEGFNMNIFDNLIESAKKKSESYTEAQPLWEYPGIALSEPVTFFSFDLRDSIPSKNLKEVGKFTFDRHSRCDGIALWMDYDLPDGESLSSGPTERVIVNEYINWDMFERQGIHLFRNMPIVEDGDSLHYVVDFNPSSGEFNFNFTFDSPR